MPEGSCKKQKIVSSKIRCSGQLYMYYHAIDYYFSYNEEVWGKDSPGRNIWHISLSASAVLYDDHVN